MTSHFVNEIRRHKPGTLQTRLSILSAEIPPEQGGDILKQALELGDHAAGLAAALSTIGLTNLDKTLPQFGQASKRVRSGTTLVFTDKGQIDKVPVMIEPSRARLLND